VGQQLWVVSAQRRKRPADVVHRLLCFVWRPNWQQTVDTFKDLVGTPHPKMAVMLDVESWGGQIRGDRSGGINAAYDAVGVFIGSTAKVIGYGNEGDLNNVWQNEPTGLRLVVAAYGHNPRYPEKVAHQHTDRRPLWRRNTGGRSAVRPLRHELRRWTYGSGIRPCLRHNNRGFRAQRCSSVKNPQESAIRVVRYAGHGDFCRANYSQHIKYFRRGSP